MFSLVSLVIVQCLNIFLLTCYRENGYNMCITHCLSPMYINVQKCTSILVPNTCVQNCTSFFVQSQVHRNVQHSLYNHPCTQVYITRYIIVCVQKCTPLVIQSTVYGNVYHLLYNHGCTSRFAQSLVYRNKSYHRIWDQIKKRTHFKMFD